MNKIFTGAAFLFLITASSCINLKKLQRGDLIAATEKNYEFLEGKYANWSPANNNSYSYSLWQALDFKKNNTFKAPRNSTVTIKALGSNALQADLWHDSIKIKTVTLKGEYKEGYFSVKRYYRTIPIPIICYLVTDHKIRIGKVMNGDLVLDAADSRFGWILLISAGSGDKYDAAFPPGQ